MTARIAGDHYMNDSKRILLLNSFERSFGKGSDITGVWSHRRDHGLAVAIDDYEGRVDDGAVVAASAF
jgi:hypothetical protein